LMKPLMRKWMAYNTEFLEEEEVVRVTNEDYIPVRRDDLEGRIDLDISISTQEDNSAKSQELSFLLQTLGPNEDPAIRRELMADIMELMRMPDQARRIREFQPQPDPMEEQMKQLELAKLQKEIELLDADIADKYARAGENQEDMKYKAWKAEVEKAKARKLNAESDLKDLDFLKIDNEYEEELENMKAERNHQYAKELAEIQRKAGDTNIGLPR
jgi:hypothetical protein